MGKAKGKSSPKSSGKGKKLDLITAELTSLRAEVRKLVKQQAELAKEIGRLTEAKPSTAKPSKAKAAKAKASKAKDRTTKRNEAPARPVLVQNDVAAVSSGRSGT